MLQVTGEATLTVQMEPLNHVREVHLSLAMPDPIAAGKTAALRAILDAEDGQPVPSHDAAEGLIVKLKPPTGQSEQLAVTDEPGVDTEQWPEGALAFGAGELTLAGAASSRS